MTALNIPSASDIERLTRRVRSVSQRLDGIEDLVDRVDGRFAALNANAGVEGRLSAIEEQLGAISRELAAIHQALARPGPARAAQPGAPHGRRGVAARRGQRRTTEAVVDPQEDRHPEVTSFAAAAARCAAGGPAVAGSNALSPMERGPRESAALDVSSGVGSDV